MFEEGFQIGNAEVEPPRSIQTAATEAAQIILMLLLLVWRL